MSEYHDTQELPSAATPIRSPSRVYLVEHDEMPGAPKLSYTPREMVEHAKRRHEKAMDCDYHDLTARMIGNNSVNGYIEVVVVER
jgi:hypothetical protein